MQRMRQMQRMVLQSAPRFVRSMGVERVATQCTHFQSVVNQWSVGRRSKRLFPTWTGVRGFHCQNKDVERRAALVFLPRLPLAFGQQRYFSDNASDPGADHYKTLGVLSTATALEIKKAYFQAAKKHHPDMNPNDKEGAKIRFQRVADAYSCLSDPVKRKDYDTYRKAGSRSSSSSNHYYDHATGTTQPSTQQQVDPYELFKKAFDDMGLEEVQQYFKEMGDEASHAMAELLSSNNWRPLIDLSKKRKGFIFAVVVPLLVIVRFPGAALLILRKGGAVASLITGALMQNPAARRIILDMIYNHWRKTARKVEQEKIRKRNLRKKRGT